MPDYGMTEAGFVLPTFEQLKAEREDLYRAAFGESINLQPDSVFGILVAIETERELQNYLEMADVYSSAYPSAIGVSLDRVCEITGVERLLPSKSTAPGLCTGTPGTIIPIGRIVRVDSTQARFQTLSEVTIGGGGTIAVNIEAIDDGPVPATTLDTYTIETPVSGWTLFAVTTDAELGRLEETDSELRVRREEQLRALGSGSVEAIAARLREVEDVTGVAIENNPTDGVVNGVAAHGFRAVVQGGADADIRQCIYDNMPATAATTGAVTGTVVDSFGNNVTINFSRPTTQNVYCNVTGTKNASLYPADGDAQITAIVAAYSSELDVGDDVMYLEITQRILTAIPGLLTLVVQLGTSEGTETAANVTISFTQIGSIIDLDLAIT